jgi:hypothetical protein
MKNNKIIELVTVTLIVLSIIFLQYEIISSSTVIVVFLVPVLFIQLRGFFLRSK